MPLFSDIPVFVQTQEPSDFPDSVTLLNADFCVKESLFKSLPDGAVVILDDFSFKQANDKQAKIEFLKVVNYYLRHHNITLMLIVHNLYNNNLLNDILLAPHIFLAYSNLGYYLIR